MPRIAYIPRQHPQHPNNLRTPKPSERPDPAPLFSAPRCGARTRAGTHCRAPRVRGKSRCRMHGGAKRSGGQAGNRNAFKNGFYARAERARVAELQALITDCERFLSTLSTPNGTLLPRPSGAWARSRKKHKRVTAPSCKTEAENTGREDRARMAARRKAGI